MSAWRPRLLAWTALLAPLSCRPDAGEHTAAAWLRPDSVSAFLERYVDAMSARDTARIRAMYSNTGGLVWIEDGAVRYRSVSEVFEALRAFSPGTSLTTELGDVEIARLGETAAHAWVPFVTTVGEGAGSYAFGGMMSVLFEARGDGARIVGGHVSSPRPRPGPASAP